MHALGGYGLRGSVPKVAGKVLWVNERETYNFPHLSIAAGPELGQRQSLLARLAPLPRSMLNVRA